MKQLFFQKPFKYCYLRSTLVLVFINIAVFLLCLFNQNVNACVKYFGSLNASLITYRHMYWQFVSYMFIHEGFSHLFFNMFALAMFGLTLERVIGTKEFLLFYFVTGIVSGLLSYVVFMLTGQGRVFLMGASGAIYALLFAYAVVFPASRILIWGIIPVRAPILVLIYAIIEIVSEVAGGGNVAHLTHLFGFLAAFLYFVIRMKINPFKVWKEAFRRQ